MYSKNNSLSFMINHHKIVFKVNFFIYIFIAFYTYFINFEIAHSQTDPSLEITIDSTNVILPINISILNNSKNDIALIKIKALNPKKILSFQTDTNQFIGYPIGISGLGITPQPQINFSRLGKIYLLLG